MDLLTAANRRSSKRGGLGTIQKYAKDATEFFFIFDDSIETLAGVEFCGIQSTQTHSKLFDNNPQVRYSSLAQLVEHAAVNRRVVGSSPTGGAKKHRRLFMLAAVFCRC